MEPIRGHFRQRFSHEAFGEVETKTVGLMLDKGRYHALMLGSEKLTGSTS